MTTKGSPSRKSRSRRSADKKSSRPPPTTRFKRSEDHSVGHHSTESARTPSSVLIGSSLNRELSDLSGSYVHGSTRGGASPCPHHVEPADPSEMIMERPWRQAHALSLNPPPLSAESVVGTATQNNKATIFMDRTAAAAVIEVVKSHDSFDRQQDDNEQPHHRLPLILLLMDPGRRCYEIMQLWIDSSIDTVRDVLHSAQKKLQSCDKWRQDYDGLFQIRGNKFSQLIHILGVDKYDVQPYEVWIAKPWSMSARKTVLNSGSMLRHLKNIGVISTTTDDTKKKLFRHNKPTDDAVWMLSLEARDRIYSLAELLKHHHAHQFLAFSPTFEPILREVMFHQDDGSASQLSESNCSTTSHISTGIAEMVVSAKPAPSKRLPPPPPAYRFNPFPSDLPPRQPPRQQPPSNTRCQKPAKPFITVPPKNKTKHIPVERSPSATTTTTSTKPSSHDETTSTFFLQFSYSFEEAQARNNCNNIHRQHLQDHRTAPTKHISRPSAAMHQKSWQRQKLTQRRRRFKNFISALNCTKCQDAAEPDPRPPLNRHERESLDSLQYSADAAGWRWDVEKTAEDNSVISEAAVPLLDRGATKCFDSASNRVQVVKLVRSPTQALR